MISESEWRQDRAHLLRDLRKLKGVNQQEVADFVGVSKNSISKYESGGGFDYGVAVLLAQYYDIDVEDIWMPESKPTVDLSRKGIPFYDIYAAAGPVDMYSDLQEYITDYLHFPGIDAKEYDFAVKVWGQSMQGVFDDGDIALCKEVQDRSMINYGAPYFIITSEFKTIKYVHTSERDGYVKLRSENDQFDTFEIPMNSIYKIFHARTGVSIKVKRISS